MSSQASINCNNQINHNNQIESDSYDRSIIPAETAARMEREGEQYKQINPDSDDPTTSGYTVSREGLINNYAVEPEMYYEVPGDLKQKEQMQAEQRAAELVEVNQTDEAGRLEVAQDSRGKGTGMI